METNACDVNRESTEALLPPRKRLLAGFKRQRSDFEGSASSTPSPPVAIASSSTLSHSSPPSSPTLTSVDFNHRLNVFLSSQLDKSQNMSPYQIVEASKSAAYAAIKAADIARAAAREKSAIAARAVSAAKTTLALVASYSEGREERNPKKNKLKKHVQVQVLYKKHKLVGNGNKKNTLNYISNIYQNKI